MLHRLSLPSAWSGFMDANTTGTSCLGPLAGLQAQQKLYRDTVAALSDPASTTLVLVARAGLGTLNHCALSVDALDRRGIPVAAVVLNRTVAEDDPSVASNARWVADLTGAQVLGPGPFVADPAARPAALAELVGRILA